MNLVWGGASPAASGGSAYCSRPMERMQRLAILVLALGLIYLGVGVVSLYQHQQLLQMFAYYGVPEDVWMSNPGIAQTRGKLWNAFIEFSIVSAIVLIVGCGLYRAKEWARKCWLALVLLLYVMHAARLAMDYQLGNMLLAERVAEVLLIGTLAVLSWLWLWRKSIGAELRGNEPAADSGAR